MHLEVTRTLSKASTPKIQMIDTTGLSIPDPGVTVASLIGGVSSSSFRAFS
jgi:hypothetical protein